MEQQTSDSEIRNQRVVTFLREWHGQDPQPLRSFLTNQEAWDLVTKHPDTPYEVYHDLDLDGYAGKWRQAVEAQIRAGIAPTEWLFWYNARVAFFEYGGCYRKGHEPPRNE